MGKDDRGRDRVGEARLKVWSPLVKQPVAGRYAWARNPLGNAVNSRHHARIILICAFRTDDWDWPEAPFKADGPEAAEAHRRQRNELRQQANRWVKQRPLDEAKQRLRAAGIKVAD